MSGFLHDVRHAIRRLSRSPGFTAIAVATLALGIGANAAIFSVVRAVLLRPLPYADSERLVTLPDNISTPELSDLRATARSFDAVGGSALQPLDLTGDGDPLQITGALVTGDLFEALGTRAALGRTLSPSDDREGGEHVAVVTHGLWLRHWGADPALVGRSVTVGGQPYTIVGVMPAGFALPEHRVELFLPARVAYPSDARDRDVHYVRPVLRLRRGVSIETARAEVAATFRRFAAAYPDSDTGLDAGLVSIHERIVGDSRSALVALSGAVGLVLLIACSNIASLLVARTRARAKELAIRSALGSSRARLARQVLAESSVLGLAGGAAGLALADRATRLFATRLPDSLPRLASVSTDRGVLIFTLVVSIATGLLFGLVPAMRAGRRAPAAGLRGARTTAGAEDRRLGAAFAVSQVALALVLLVGAGLLANTLWRLRSIDPGFPAEGLVTAHLDLPESRYKRLPSQLQFRRRLLDLLTAARLRAAMVSELPLGGSDLNHQFVIEGRPAIPTGQEPRLYSRSVMGDYFGTMGMRLLGGRKLSDADREDAPLVAVVNESMARLYFPGGSPIGARFRWARDSGPPQWIEIVGLVSDVRHFGLSTGDLPAVYTPYAQFGLNWKRWADVVVRSPEGTPALAELLRAKIREADPLLPVKSIRLYEDVVSTSLERPRFLAGLLGAFAGAALLLATLGVVGVLGNLVARRTREIGVRIALGADPARVRREVIGEGARIAAAGIGIGLAGALAASRALTQLLYAVHPIDPATYAAVSLLLAAAAIGACYLPARRASRIDPIEALRSE
ncbi:MAG TPA: ABC transporter permease [Thermoanaerobaculia bacterium]